MQKFDTHLCLVSDQTIPNLIPVLDPNNAPKKVVLAVSAAMHKQAARLEKIIQRRSISVERLDISNAYDYHNMEEVFLNWVSEHTQDNVALNVTGGTKPMAMAAQAAFSADSKPIFYISIESDEIIQLDEKQPNVRLPSIIKLNEYLESYGYQIKDNKLDKPNQTAAQLKLGNDLVKKVGYFAAALGDLNSLAEKLHATLTDKQSDSRSLGELLNLFENSGYLKQETRGGKIRRITFPNEAARKYVNGGWLEYHVYSVISNLAPQIGIGDSAINLKVIAPDGKTQNELDVAFIYRNTLYLIECKAGNLARASELQGDTKGTDALYKLGQLRGIGGLRCRAMLIDYRGRLSKEDKQRAIQDRVLIASGGELQNLGEKIRAWLQPHKN